MARNHFYSVYSVFVVTVLIVCIAAPLYVRADANTAVTPAQIACIGTAVHTREASMNTALGSYFDALKTSYTARATALDVAYTKSTLEALQSAESLARLSFSSSVLDAFALMKRTQLSAETAYANARHVCITGDADDGDDDTGGDTGGGDDSGDTGGTASTTPPVASTTPTVLFSDDFHRSDGDIGNGWNVTCAGVGATITIENNKLANTGNNNGGCAYWRVGIPQVSGISITSQFSGSTLGTDRWFVGGIGVKGIASGSYDDVVRGYSFQTRSWGDGQLQITDNGNLLVTGTYLFNNTDTFQIEVDISAAPQNWMDVYIWDTTTSSKPSQPTISFHNGGDNYTPLATGNAFYANFSTNGYQTSSSYNYLYQIASL